METEYGNKRYMTPSQITRKLIKKALHLTDQPPAIQKLKLYWGLFCPIPAELIPFLPLKHNRCLNINKILFSDT